MTKLESGTTHRTYAGWQVWLQRHRSSLVRVFAAVFCLGVLGKIALGDLSQLDGLVALTGGIAVGDQLRKEPSSPTVRPL